ncbi:hypothetical protein Tco_1353856 [Tanacetum coccineum]
MKNLTDMLSKFVNANTASFSGTGSLPSNIVTNPKEDLKGITTQSGVAYQGPTIPTTSSSPKVVERETEVIKDTMLPTNNGSTKDVQPPVVQVQPQVPNSEPVVTPVIAPMPNLKPTIPYPSRFMSLSPHSTITSSSFDMENAFSTMNIHNYTSASSATSGSTSFNSSEDSRDGMIPPTSSLFYNNPYLKDVQAFYAKESPIPPPDPITPPVILTLSLVLPTSLLFDPLYFFVPEELLPPKKQIHSPSSSLTTLFNSSRKQAYNLEPPSFLIYTPTPPQIFFYQGTFEVS